MHTFFYETRSNDRTIRYYNEDPQITYYAIRCVIQINHPAYGTQCGLTTVAFPRAGVDPRSAGHFDTAYDTIQAAQAGTFKDYNYGPIPGPFLALL
jgi:hypothetical protein